MTKELLHVMLALHNMRMKPSNVRKNKGTSECDQRTVTCDIGTTQFENGTIKCEKQSEGTTKFVKRTVTYDAGIARSKDGTVKCEKKVREPSNVRKELSHMMLDLQNVKME